VKYPKEIKRTQKSITLASYLNAILHTSKIYIFFFGGDDQRLKKTFKIKKQLHEFEINLKFILFMNILESTWILVENFS
jgi:hypothetical protein